MLGYMALDVLNRITPADISDPPELIARAAALSLELDTSITPGFAALDIIPDVNQQMIALIPCWW